MSTSAIVSVRVPDDLVAALDAEAARLDRSRSWVIVRALRERYAREDLAS